MPEVTPSPLIVGRDVPWVTSWSQEPLSAVGPCPTVDGQLAALQAWKPGVGKPLYSQNHLRRQRDSVRALLCPMCGEATADGDRWSQTGRFVAAGALRARGFAQALPADLADDGVLLDCGAIAPLHLRCAEVSLKRCPHLKGLRDRELKVFPPAWVVVPLHVAVPRAVGAPLSAVSFLQLLGVTTSRDSNWRARLAPV